MNSSIKSTFPLFESICVLDGAIKNAEYHSKRFQHSYRKFFWDTPNFGLFDGIEIPSEFQEGRVKLRISYNKYGKTHSIEKYSKREIKTLKLVISDAIDYDLKFENRGELNELFQLKQNCDDILIVKKGDITDCSYANITFWDGNTWYTPTSFLLKGTKRTQLLNNGFIEEMPIRMEDLKEFQGFQLINAMLDFEPEFYHPIEYITL